MALGGLLTTLLVLALVGFVLWLILTYIPMPEPFGKVIMVIVVVIVILWLIGQITGVGVGNLGLRR